MRERISCKVCDVLFNTGVWGRYYYYYFFGYLLITEQLLQSPLVISAICGRVWRRDLLRKTFYFLIPDALSAVFVPLLLLTAPT